MKIVVQACEVKHDIISELLDTFGEEDFDIVVAYDDKRIEYDAESTEYLKDKIYRNLETVGRNAYKHDEVYLLCMSGALQVSDATTAIEKFFTIPKYKMVYSKKDGKWIIREW